jgi:hypothetical protein
LARISCAFINVVFAILSVESREALAGVIVDSIYAFGSILARLRLALIIIGFAMLPAETGLAFAFVFVMIVFKLDACSVVLARLTPANRRKAQRDIFLPPPRKSGAMKAFAAFIVSQVKALQK